MHIYVPHTKSLQSYEHKYEKINADSICKLMIVMKVTYIHIHVICEHTCAKFEPATTKILACTTVYIKTDDNL